MQAARGQGKHWCFTINHPVQEDMDQLTALQPLCNYCIIGHEFGESGTPHLQGYICMKQKKKFQWMKKHLLRAHLEVKRGSVKEAADYCKKDGQFQEYGTLPEEQYVAGGRKNAENWTETKALAKSGQLEEIDAEIYVKYYSTLRRIKADHRAVPADLPWTNSPPNEWIYGETGTGKSRTARSENPGCYLKMNNKWWENYEDESCVLIEDVGTTHTWMGDFLKIWADRYGFRAEVKHLSVVLRPQKIIVTSNYHPKDLWQDENILNPILRRFKLRHFVKSVVDTIPKPDVQLPVARQLDFDDPGDTLIERLKMFETPKPKLSRTTSCVNLAPFKRPRYRYATPPISSEEENNTLVDEWENEGGEYLESTQEHITDESTIEE